MAQSDRSLPSNSSLSHVTSLLDQAVHYYVNKHRVRKDVLATWKKSAVAGWRVVLVASDIINSSRPVSGQKMICFCSEQIAEYKDKKAAVLVDVLIPFHYPNQRPCIILRRPDNLRELDQTYAYIPSHANDEKIKRMEIYSLSGGRNLINLDVTEMTRKVFRLQLHSAVQDGRADIVKQLLDDGFPCNELDDNYLTPMRLAVQRGHAEIASLLLKRGGKLWNTDKANNTDLLNRLPSVAQDFCQPVWQTKALLVTMIMKCTDPRNGLSLLMKSAQQSHCLPVLTMLLELGEPVVALQADVDLPTLSLLLELGADVNSMIKSGYNYAKSCLHDAVQKENIDVMYELLAAGADIHRVDSNNKSALHVTQSKETALVLLSAGADVNARDSSGCTSIVSAKDLALLKLLITHGADVNARTNEGFTAICYRKNQRSHLSVFLRAGAFLETPLGKANLLHLVRSVEEVKVFLKYPEAVKRALCDTDEYGRTPLQAAAESNRTQGVFKLLLPFASQTVLNHKDSDGHNSLHLAVQNLLPAAELLLKADAAVDERGPYGNTALHMLTDRMKSYFGNNDDDDDNSNDDDDDDDCSECSGDKRDRPCVLLSDTYLLDLLLQAGANPKAQNNDGDTPLHMALQRRQTKLVEVLLKATPQPWCEKNKRGETVLHLAAAWSPTIVRSLLDAGAADVNAQDIDKRSPLHVALRNGQNDIVEQLLAAGADPTIADNKGYRPIDFTSNAIMRKLKVGKEAQKK